MRKIIISPCSKAMRNGKENPKNYPYWPEVIDFLKSHGFFITQVGISSERRLNADEFRVGLSLLDLREAVRECVTWASVDNFFHHLCWLENKPGVVIFGRSDPMIFGHDLNDNILKSRTYLRSNQFGIWEDVEFSPDPFVSPDIVVETILKKAEQGGPTIIRSSGPITEM